jgi:hypothetical protein
MRSPGHHPQPKRGKAQNWRPMKSAPMDGTCVQLFGTMRENEHLQWPTPQVFSGYWDAIDEAWCSNASRWDGPFFDPIMWQPLPAPPAMVQP